MPTDITPIRLTLPYKLGRVNCYLIHTDAGYLLIDTGSSNQRAEVEKELASAGCQPGDLKLIILTHGDFDHTGNAAYLREKFGAKIAMHADDTGMLERGDMFWNRKKGNALLRKIAPALFGFGKSQRCHPDVVFADGGDLSAYGWDAQMLHLPGHSAGSIGILTSAGDLFCGDLLESLQQPALNSIMDDVPTAQVSIERLKGLKVKTVYPGHGTPFPWELFLNSHGK
jgi:glyoxylase-like metal-dependent hydrolase (beta-lactamase superfamily II)